MTKIIQINSLEEAAEEMKKIDVDPRGIEIMKKKFIFKVLKLKDVKTAWANIIKQEMLSLGADAATSEDTVGCKKPTTDVLLAGTVSQLERLVAKLREQVGGLKDIADEIADNLG